MNISYSSLKFAFVLLTLGLHHVTAQPLGKVVECVSPAILLRAFPVVPETWKCMESKGSTDVSVMGVPITTAVRRYVLPVETPPESSSPETVQVPRTLRIIAMDLGSRGEDPTLRSIPTENIFALPGLSGAIKSYTGRFIYEGIGTDRLVVQIEARGITDPEFRNILKQLPLENLSAVEERFPKSLIPSEKQQTILNEKPATLLVRKITNIVVDELDSSKNRSWESSVIDQMQ